MAGCDYYLCDICGCETFYDVELYGYRGPENMNPNTGHLWPDGDVGDMSVICKDCAKTHRIEIKPIVEHGEIERVESHD